MTTVRLTTNTTGTQPIITIGYAGSDLANTSLAVTMPFVQDITITNKTGVYSYVNFTDADTRKLSTPADNEIGMNIVLDKGTFFGANVANLTAVGQGVINMSNNKTPIDFKIYWAGNGTATDVMTTGSGFITNLAPVTKPDAPVWVSPMSIAVDGYFTTVTNA